MTNDEKILNIPVMILCGGLGTRLHEATEVRPKPMVEIGGRPILWHLMKYYASHGLDEFILCLGYKGSVIKDYFLNYKSLNSFSFCFFFQLRIISFFFLCFFVEGFS